MKPHPEHQEKLVHVLEVVDHLKRWWWASVAGLVLGLAGGLLALDQLPKSYRAVTLILVGPSQIPQQWVQVPEASSMAIRLRSLRDSVLSRDYLARLVEDVYGTSPAGIEGERLMAQIRPRLDVRVVPVDRQRGSGYFELSFTDEDPQRAANVVNALADSFISANVSARIADAHNSERLQKRLMDESLNELRRRKNEVNNFKERYQNLLPEFQNQTRSMWEARRRDLEAVERNIQEVTGQIALLRAEKLENDRLRRDLGTSSPGQGQSWDEKLARAQKDLDDALLDYTENHPEVQSKRRVLEAIRDNPPGAVAGGQTDGGSLDGLTPLEAQIQTEEQRLATLRVQKTRIEADVAQFQSRFGSMPKVARDFDELSDGLSTLERSYEERLRNYEASKAARIALEEEQGEQFDVIDRAVAPLLPISPKPMRVFGMAIGIGFLAMVVPLVVLRLLRPVVYSESALEALIDVPVLVKISEIDTKAVRARKRRRVLLNVALSAASIGVLAVAAFVTIVPKMFIEP